MHKRKIKRQFKNFRIYKDLYGKLCKRNWVAKVVFLKQMPKAWFPYDRPDRPNHPSRFKIFRDDPDNWGDW